MLELVGAFERASGAVGYAAGRFEPEAHRHFVSVVSEEGAYRHGFDALATAFILHIEREPSGVLWVCANNGFYKVDPQKGVVARYWRGGTGAKYKAGF